MFSRALYYPSIDISDEEWLKTAYLFWDEIDTIVPESLSGHAYNSYTSQFLEGEGFLRPYLVSPDSYIVKSLANTVRRYASTDEGIACLNQISVDTNPYSDDRAEFYLHSGKLPMEIQELVADSIGDDGWARVSNNFANYYMTLLANSIANQHSFALLTDSSTLSNLTSRVREDKGGRFVFSSERATEGVFQNFLVKMIIDGIKIDPLTSFEDLRQFKNSHRDELRRFRNGIDEMTNPHLPEGISIEGMEQMVKDVYDNKVLLAYNDLKASLKGSHISVLSEVASLFYTGITTTMLDLVSDISVPLKFSIGAGVFFGVKCLAAYKGKTTIKQSNKMSYLLSIDQNLASKEHATK